MRETGCAGRWAQSHPPPRQQQSSGGRTGPLPQELGPRQAVVFLQETPPGFPCTLSSQRAPGPCARCLCLSDVICSQEQPRWVGVPPVPTGGGARQAQPLGGSQASQPLAQGGAGMRGSACALLLLVVTGSGSLWKLPLISGSRCLASGSKQLFPPGEVGTVGTSLEGGNTKQ